MGKWKDRLKRWRLVRWAWAIVRPAVRWWRALRIYLMRTTLPGFQGQSAFRVLSIFYGAIIESDFTIRAAAMAYNFFFALFPALIFLFSLLPYIPVDDLEGQVRTSVREYLPPDTFALVEPTLRQTLNEGSLGVTLISLGLVLFAATRGVRSLLAAFHKTEGTAFRQRYFWESLVLSLGIFIGLSVLALLAVTILIGGEITLFYLSQRLHLLESWSYVLLSVSSLLVNLLLLFALAGFLYYFVPAHGRRWRFFSPGSILGGTLLFLAQLMLRWYFINFVDYNKIYGTLATVMVLMVWFYYNSIVLLLGFELNASIDLAAHRSGNKTLAQEREG